MLTSVSDPAKIQASTSTASLASENSSRPRAFIERDENSKLEYLLQLLNDLQPVVKKVVNGDILLKVCHLPNRIQDNVSDAFANNPMSLIQILCSKCEAECFNFLFSIITANANSKKVICKYSKCCAKDNFTLSKNMKMISCDSCLLWYHYSCVNISRKPRSKY